MAAYEHIEYAKTCDDLIHKCSDYSELRERVKSQGTSYAMQCTFCGYARGGEVSKKKVSDLPPPFDTELAEKYDAKVKALYKARLDETISAEFELNTSSCRETQYELFVQSIESVIAEVQESSSEVNISEFFQRYLRKQRGNIANNFRSRWENEDALCNWFIETFSEWFEIKQEVWGAGYVNRQKRRVRIDFVLKAKPELVALGFTEQYIGVEVKHFSVCSGHKFHAKSSSGVFQALSYWYSDAVWEIDGDEPKSLATVLLFSNISFSDERSLVFNTYDNYYRTLWQSYLKLANHANVGELLVSENSGSGLYWAMAYDAANYFSRLRSGELRLGNPNVINKARIGNRQ